LSIADDIETTRSKIAALGLEIRTEFADPGGLASPYVLYWASVVRRDAAEDDQFSVQQAIERSPEEALCRAAVQAFMYSSPEAGPQA
jgi:hypothetical protein